MTEEQWKPHPEFPRYLVSDQGRVRGVKGGILKPGHTDGGYRFLTLSRPDFRHPRKVGRIVLETFVGPRPPGLEVGHLNGNKTDDRLTNLAYITKLENEAHKLAHGTRASGDRHGTRVKPESVPRGERSYLAKLTEAKVVEIKRRLSEGEHHVSIANAFGVSRRAISCIDDGSTWKHLSPKQGGGE